MSALKRKEAREVVVGLLFETEFKTEDNSAEIFAISSENREIPEDDYIKSAYFNWSFVKHFNFCYKKIALILDTCVFNVCATIGTVKCCMCSFIYSYSIGNSIAFTARSVCATLCNCVKHFIPPRKSQ